MAKKRLLPFSVMPGSWGLKGKTFEIAKAEYELEGIDLEVKLAEINHGITSKEARANRVVREYKNGKITEHEQDKMLIEIIEPEESKELKLLETEYRFSKITHYEYDQSLAKLTTTPETLLIALIAVDLKHSKITPHEHDKRIVELESDETTRAINLLGVELRHSRINEYDHDIQIAELTADETAKAVALLEVELKHKKISEQEFEKRTHTLEKKPWVTVDMAVAQDNPSQIGAFELDWNEYFILELQKSGYSGMSETEIVDQWFSMTCATIAAEQGIVLPEAVLPEPDMGTPKRKGRPKKNKDPENIRREYR